FALFLILGIFAYFIDRPFVFRDYGARWYFYFSIIITATMCTALMHHLYMTSMQAERSLASERKKSDSLLLNILPERIAEELKLKGTALPVHFDSATILFTDFEGFTRIAERWTPATLVHELDYCFSEFDRIVEKHKLEKLKTIGDSYMCAAGIPETTQTHALDAVHAALDMLRFIRKRRDEQLAAGKEYWNIRIGLHSGPLIAGVVGKRKFAYDIWGDTVNTASRLESSGVPGAINVSEQTYQLTRSNFEYKSRGRIEAKGKEPLAMYLLLDNACSSGDS
ncbi:MAG: adenylate/guanylate cyclase domain-containing protein, partial [Spirochaetia bacterium]|nr:adenylate/guanylate cyclase domain-containing protein [Spirochaetia bacterium]